MRTHARPHAHGVARTQPRTHACTHKHTHAHTHTRTSTHTHTRARARTQCHVRTRVFGFVFVLFMGLQMERAPQAQSKVRVLMAEVGSLREELDRAQGHQNVAAWVRSHKHTAST